MASDPNRPFQPEGLKVPPLNSMPYIDPVASMSVSYDKCQGEGQPEAPKPALVFFPSKPTDEEWRNVLSVTNGGIGLSGTAALGSIGPVVGKIDIGDSGESYSFRVSLPGVAREEFTCDVTPDGWITIKGITTTGEKTIYKHSLKFEMQSQNLCPPGHFSVSFQLPGPVDSRHLIANFGMDGVFEGIVKKKTAN